METFYEKLAEDNLNLVEEIRKRDALIELLLSRLDFKITNRRNNNNE